MTDQPSHPCLTLTGINVVPFLLSDKFLQRTQRVPPGRRSPTHRWLFSFLGKGHLLTCVDCTLWNGQARQTFYKWFFKTSNRAAPRCHTTHCVRSLSLSLSLQKISGNIFCCTFPLMNCVCREIGIAVPNFYASSCKLKHFIVSYGDFPPCRMYFGFFLLLFSRIFFA